ncbi:MAG: DUF4130 domain-containing protein [Bacillota bacterium]
MKEILYSSCASSLIKAVLLSKFLGDAFLKSKSSVNGSLFDSQQIDVDKLSSGYIYSNYQRHYGHIHGFANSNFNYFKRQINLAFRHQKEDKYPLLEKVVQDSLEHSLEYIMAKCTNEGRKFDSYYNQVNAEVHANKGFSRLQPVEDKVLIGYIQTEHHTGDLILSFFVKRFPGFAISLIVE